MPAAIPVPFALVALLILAACAEEDGAPIACADDMNDAIVRFGEPERIEGRTTASNGTETWWWFTLGVKTRFSYSAAHDGCSTVTETFEPIPVIAGNR